MPYSSSSPRLSPSLLPSRPLLTSLALLHLPAAPFLPSADSPPHLLNLPLSSFPTVTSGASATFLRSLFLSAHQHTHMLTFASFICKKHTHFSQKCVSSCCVEQMMVYIFFLQQNAPLNALCCLRLTHTHTHTD